MSSLDPTLDAAVRAKRRLDRATEAFRSAVTDAYHAHPSYGRKAEIARAVGLSKSRTGQLITERDKETKETSTTT